jgi:O-antigen/teichoic acid export membrane protein
MTQHIAARRINLNSSVQVLRKWSPALVAANLALALLFTAVVGAGGGEAAIAAAFFVLAMPLTASVSILEGIATGLGLFRIVNTGRIVVGSVRLVSIPLLFVLGWLNLVWALVALLVSQVLAGSVMVLMLRKRHRLARGVENSSRIAATHLLRSSMRLLVGAGLAVSMSRLDQSIALPLTGPEQLGFYAVAVAVFEVPKAVGAALRMHRLGSYEAAGGRRAQLRAVGAAFLMGLFCAVVGWSVAPTFIPLLFGHEFAPAVAVTIVLLFALPVSIGLNVGTACLIRSDRDGTQIWGNGTALVFNLIGVLVLVPSWGAMGLAVASVAGFVVGFVVVVTAIVRGSGKGRPTGARKYVPVRWRSRLGPARLE